MPLTISLADLDTTNSVRFFDSTNSSTAGYTVGLAGDVNDDGFVDLLIGAPKIHPWMSGTGSAYVVFGSATGFSDTDLGTLTPAQGIKFDTALGVSELGRIVGGAGDVNGDNVADFFVTAPGSEKAFVAFGGSGLADLDAGTFSSGDGFVINGITKLPATPLFTNWLTSAGDVNGDGIDDLIGSARSYGEKHEGVAVVVYGSQTGLSDVDVSSLVAGSEAGFAINGRRENDGAGTFVSAAGDLNGDGYDDVVVTTNYGGSAREQSIFVLFGRNGGYSGVDLADISAGSADGFEIAWLRSDGDIPIVSSAGDVNGDGYDDLLFGGAHSGSVNDQGDRAGSGYIVFGHAGGFSNIDMRRPLPDGAGITIGQTGLHDYEDDLGRMVMAVGDVNGDGIDDVGVMEELGAGGHNALHIVFGRAGLSNDIDLDHMLGSGGFTIDLSGASQIAAVGDVNGDGRDDIMVAKRSEVSYASEAHIVFAPQFGDDVIGSEDADTLTGTSLAEAMSGLGGNDTLNAGEGDDLVFGEAGDDTLNGEDGNDQLEGGEGNDRLAGGAGADILNGGAGDDLLEGGAGDDLLEGGDGQDTFVVSAGADQFDGGDGKDTVDYSGLSGALTFSGLGGYVFYQEVGVGGVVKGDTLISIETIICTGFDDTVTFSIYDRDRHVVLGGAGNDTLGNNYANSGDVLVGGAGADTLIGGYASYQTSGAALVVDLGAGTVSGGDADGDTLVNVAGVIGTRFDDHIVSSTGSAKFDGLAGDDVIVSGGGGISASGGDGDDRLIGGNHHDYLYGGNGKDFLKGGSSQDKMFGENGNDRLIAGAGSDVLQGGNGDDSLLGGGGIDKIVGNDGDDLLKGGTGEDRLDGGDGKDRLVGGGQSDRLVGGNGNDILVGGGGFDDLFGGGGRDVLSPGRGHDRMWGGAGHDVFLFKNLADSSSDSPGGGYPDEIMDYTPQDVINFARIDANTNKPGNQAFHSVGFKDFTGTAGELLLRHDGSEIDILLDVDGDGRSDFAIYVLHANKYDHLNIVL